MPIIAVKTVTNKAYTAAAKAKNTTHLINIRLPRNPFVTKTSIENGENNKALNKNSAVMPKKAKAIKFATAAETVAHTAPCLMAQ